MIPQTHFMRFRNGLTSMVKQQRAEIEKTRAANKITADYSLGFVNALIFVEHQLSQKKGEPVFYNRTTSVGSLPKPIALNSGERAKDTTTYQVLMDHVLLHARNLIGAGNEGRGAEIPKALDGIEKAIQQLDDFSRGEKEHELGHESGNEQGADGKSRDPGSDRVR